MNKDLLKQASEEIFEHLPGNILSPDMNIREEYVGLRIYDQPITGFGDADDPLFEEFKKPEVIGPWHMSPGEWLPEAKTVISFFFPAGSEVRESNRRSDKHASDLWVYMRIEGQEYIVSFMQAIAEWFMQHGISACVPSIDPRWRRINAGESIEGFPDVTADNFGSSWSERHAAYVCGLGTFGLSRGIITKRGMAGRFGSILVSEKFDTDPRPYTGIYDYCIRCGACVRRCPAHAISLERGKDNLICGAFVGASQKIHAPRYGCGLCQTGVPCEDRIPPGRA